MQPNNRGFLDPKLYNKKFTKAADVKNWTFIIFDNCARIDEAYAFAKQMAISARNFRIHIHQPEVHDLPSEHHGEIVDIFINAKTNGTQLIMAITKMKFDEIHSFLKSLEALYGVVTQHISRAVFDKVLTGNANCTNTLLLNMNSKTGGVNHTVSLAKAFSSLRIRDFNNNLFDSRNRMIVGISLSHAGPQSFADRALNVEQSEPSVVAMSYSLKSATELASDYWYQHPRLTSISDIEAHFQLALEHRQSHCGSLPDDIIVFRAGASEGEFTKVKLEMEQLSRVFTSFGNGQYNPSLTAIVIMRDSNYRLFPDSLPCHGPPKKRNALHGSVVDKGITNPHYSEFIMVPHTALKGSCRPIRCTVVTYAQGRRGTLLTLKEMEVLTNSLCYANQAATTSTGIPVVLCAAEKVAKRGRNNWVFANLTDESRYLVSGSSCGHGRYQDDGSPDFFQKMTRELASKAAGMYWL